MSTFLPTPPDWPLVLTGRAETLAADPSDLDRAVAAGEAQRVAEAAFRSALDASLGYHEKAAR